MLIIAILLSLVCPIEARDYDLRKDDTITQKNCKKIQ